MRYLRKFQRIQYPGYTRGRTSWTQIHQPTGIERVSVSWGSGTANQRPKKNELRTWPAQSWPAQKQEDCVDAGLALACFPFRVFVRPVLADRKTRPTEGARFAQICPTFCFGFSQAAHNSRPSSERGLFWSGFLVHQLILALLRVFDDAPDVRDHNFRLD